MFKVAIWCGNWNIMNGKLLFLPQIGERMMINGRPYEVKMLTYHIADGDFTVVPVTIEVVQE